MRRMNRFGSTVPATLFIFCFLLSGCIVVADWVFVKKMDESTSITDYDEEVDPDKYYNKTEEYHPALWEDPIKSIGMTMGKVRDWIVGGVSGLVTAVLPAISIFTLDTPLLMDLGFPGALIRFVLITVIVLGIIDLFWI